MSNYLIFHICVCVNQLHFRPNATSTPSSSSGAPVSRRTTNTSLNISKEMHQKQLLQKLDEQSEEAASAAAGGANGQEQSDKRGQNGEGGEGDDNDEVEDEDEEGEEEVNQSC